MKITTVVLIGFVFAMLLACIGVTFDVFDSLGNTFTIDDTTVSLSDVGTGQRIAVGVAVFVALVITFVLAAVAVLIGLAAALLGVVIAVVAGLAVMAVLFSPVILVAVLVWLAVRTPKARPASAQIEPSMQA